MASLPHILIVKHIDFFHVVYIYLLTFSPLFSKKKKVQKYYIYTFILNSQYKKIFYVYGYLECILGFINMFNSSGISFAIFCDYDFSMYLFIIIKKS